MFDWRASIGVAPGLRKVAHARRSEEKKKRAFEMASFRLLAVDLWEKRRLRKIMAGCNRDQKASASRPITAGPLMPEI